ncbi:DUF3800 domain-containing protein [Marinivivus vitaminiproducens]|uniref:DUF3800 domain-containing protein n=1 Tax=Marinivivus vitaminiproducens TaxID=3035935 RepID=UPI00279EF642|nr:DUF3800 domain-containing protein [Geminicoccaceae bacterium SCSIO 64248]
MDESNFTGSNLLDPNQPVFSVGSSDIDDREAEDILRSSFPKYKAQEFKFTELWRKRRNLDFRMFAKHISENDQRYFVYIIEKKYSVLTKLIDFLIEPLFNKAGFDFYSGGFCWRYVNKIYYLAENERVGDVLGELVNTYQRFSRKPSKENLLNMFQDFVLIHQKCSGEFKDFMKLAIAGCASFEYNYSIDKFIGTDDIQMTTMIGVVAHWRRRSDDDFIVIYDDSSNVSRRLDIWSRITSSNAPAHEHPIGNGSSVIFPLRVVKSIGRDSKTSYALQLCDIVSGLSSKIFNFKFTDDDQLLALNILESGFSQLRYDGVRYQDIFPTVDPDKRGELDAVDMMVRTIFPGRADL